MNFWRPLGGGLAGAHLWYVLTNLEAYRLDWQRVLALNSGPPVESWRDLMRCGRQLPA